MSLTEKDTLINITLNYVEGQLKTRQMHLISHLQSLIRSSERLLKEVEAGNYGSLGEYLQNTWSLYHSLGRAETLDETVKQLQKIKNS